MNFKPKHLVASYQWKAADTSPPGADDVDNWFAVSTPGDKEYPRSLGRWTGKDWLDINDEPLRVTFWASLPETPEDLLAAEQPKPAEPEFKLEKSA